MARKNGPWTITETIQQYRDGFIDVRQDRVIRPDGQPGTYATVTAQRGVAILPLDRDGTAFLTRQFRYALGRESVEVPSGAIDGNESPLEAARREAREELGIVAREWTDLGVIDLDTSIIRAPVWLYLARDLDFTATEREGTEQIATLKVPFDEALRMVLAGEITHAPSCVLILKVRQSGA